MSIMSMLYAFNTDLQLQEIHSSQPTATVRIGLIANHEVGSQ